jgi:hypothetical protein
MSKFRTAVLAVLFFIPWAVEAQELNTLLMRSTFKIAGKTTLGTAFIIGRPLAKESRAAYVLVTAAHVLRDIDGEEAVLFLRKKTGDVYERLRYPIRIRSGSKPLWVQHPTGDVAAMYVALPKDADVQLLSTTMLASDEDFLNYEIHPGDSLSCLGFPYGAEANDIGFPVLRSGQIASYPIVPTKQYPTFLYDFRVFGGNSGGPVYMTFIGRSYGGTLHLESGISLILGLVSEEKILDEEIRSLSEVRHTQHQLGLAVVVAAPLIRATIELLPPPSEQQ